MNLPSDRMQFKGAHRSSGMVANDGVWSSNYSVAKWSGLAAVVLALLGAGSTLQACPVPVYQYSLEHWPSDPYQVVVHHVGDFNEDQQAALEFLRETQNNPSAGANFELRIEEDNGNPSGQVEVFYPEMTPIRTPVWSGDLTLENAEALVSSPLRQRLGEALMNRTSAVWILLESGDAEKDREIEALLNRELASIVEETVVPETAEWGGELVDIDFNVNFDVIRLSRDDPDEQMLVHMLLASEPDLATDFQEHPIVFPIYGRGLILYALVGRGINEWTLRAAAEFLTGPCSCQVKEDNPGTDLLMSVNWDEGIQPMTPASVGGATGAGGFLRHHDEAEQQED